MNDNNNEGNDIKNQEKESCIYKQDMNWKERLNEMRKKYQRTLETSRNNKNEGWGRKAFLKGK